MHRRIYFTPYQPQRSMAMSRNWHRDEQRDDAQHDQRWEQQNWWDEDHDQRGWVDWTRNRHDDDRELRELRTQCEEQQRELQSVARFHEDAMRELRARCEKLQSDVAHYQDG